MMIMTVTLTEERGTEIIYIHRYKGLVRRRCLATDTRGEEDPQAPDEEAWSGTQDYCRVTQLHSQRVVAIPLPLYRRCYDGQGSLYRNETFETAMETQTFPIFSTLTAVLRLNASI